MDMLRYMDDNGNIIRSPEPPIDNEILKKQYKIMLLCRLLDERMFKMQRQGRIGFYIASMGEEATYVGSVSALEERDWVFLCYREPGAAFWRGFSLNLYIAQMMGNAHDLCKGRQMPNHYASKKLKLSSISSPVGTQIPQAAGCAWAAKLSKSDEIALVYFGEGATSGGDFHTAMNFAGVFKLPVIFLCRNNQFAISVPVERQTAVMSISEKACAYGFEGRLVDGNDVLAVYDATKRAVEKARAGQGPTLIEALTYRRGAHSTSDDPRMYRKDEDVSPWIKRDPIARMKNYLINKNLLTNTENEELEKELNAAIVNTITEEEKTPMPIVDSLFDDVYAEILPHLSLQKEYIKKYIVSLQKNA